MAIKINQIVNQSGLSRQGCYIQVVPKFLTGTKDVHVGRNIWATKESYEENPSKGSIASLNEIRDSFRVSLETAPENCEGLNVCEKMIYWISEQVKEQILEDNPSWDEHDIQITDIKTTINN